jgi:hypothetical protein
MLYSYQGSRPAPLPFRIHVNGTTRTDPSTFTAEEIAAAGLVGPYTEPLYDPATHQLDWINGAYVITPIPPPPPQPDWERFKSALLTDPAANAALAAALPAAPGAVMALPAALMAASTGQIRDFRAAWLLLRRQGLVPAQILNAATALAVDCGLPDDFVGFMGGTIPKALDPSWNPPEDPSRGLEWTAPDGSVWRWDQPRDPQTGQYLADDPATAEVESAPRWVWVTG